MIVPVADASVLLATLLSTPDTRDSLLLVRRTQLRVPDIAHIEVRAVLRALYQQGEIDHDQLVEAERRVNRMPFDTVPTNPHVERAYTLSMTLSEPIYSCVYLALAVATGSVLVTTDHRFIRTAQRMPTLARVVRHISEPI